MTEFHWTERVYYEDTDAGGVVYHARYLHFAERARTEWLRHNGVTHAALLQQYGQYIVVRSCKITFLQPARLDDQLHIHCWPEPSRNPIFRVGQRMDRDGTVLVRLRIAMICVNQQGRPSRLPSQLGWLLP